VPWQGKPLIRHAAELIASLGLPQFVTVLGSEFESVAAELAQLDCVVVVNHNWSQGQGSSVSCGIENLHPDTDAVIFFVADQPRITKELIESIIATANCRDEEIIIPVCAGKRRNPVLFKKSTFDALKKLDAGSGGKSIFPDHSFFEMEWPNSGEFADIDTVKDYMDLVEGDESQ